MNSRLKRGVPFLCLLVYKLLLMPENILQFIADDLKNRCNLNHLQVLKDYNQQS